MVDLNLLALHLQHLGKGVDLMVPEGGLEPPRELPLARF